MQVESRYYFCPFWVNVLVFQAALAIGGTWDSSAGIAI
jgi:hypothetical protein